MSASPGISSNLPVAPTAISRAFLIGWAGLMLGLLVPAVLLLGLDKLIFGLAAAGVVIGVFLVTQPRLAFYLFLATLAFHIPYFGLPIGIYPYDIGAFLFFGAIIVDLWLHGGTLEGTDLDFPFLLFIAAACLSCIFAYDPSRGLISAGRLLFIYLMYRGLVHFGRKFSLKKIVMAYFWFVVILSSANILQFLASGGAKRAFGTASVSYESFAMTGFAMSLWFLVRATRGGERFRYVLTTLAIIGGTIASQSRGPLISFALTIPFVLIVASGLARREGRKSLIGGVVLSTLVVGMIVGVIALFKGELFAHYLVRLQQIPQSLAHPEGTILLRLVLWKVAWIAFLQHPLTGIGLGNFGIIEQIVLASKAHPLWYYVHDATAHNVILHYLAETGFLGGSALLFLSWRGLTLARRGMRLAHDQATTTMHGAVYASMFVFFITLFFMRAWTWEQGAHVFSLLFACAALAHADAKKVTV